MFQSREFLDDYQALIAGRAAAELVGWSTVRVTGDDRTQLLHNLATNDVKRLTPGQGCETFFCDARGKLVAHAFVLVQPQEIWLLAEPGLGPKLASHFDRYVIREDVQATDVSEDFRWLLIGGGESGGESAMNRLAATAELPAWGHVAAVDGAAVPCERLVACPLPWCGGWLLAVKPDRRDDVLAALSLVACSEAAWQALRIESAWPLYGVDFDESNLPQEVGRDAAAINFRKGCYLGQETVARIDALGHVNQQLAKVRFAGGGVPSAGAVLTLEGRPVGRVTSACWSPKHQAPLALAILRCEAAAAEVVINGNGIVATVLTRGSETGNPPNP
jgi:folate-binding protein YgfZ